MSDRPLALHVCARELISCFQLEGSITHPRHGRATATFTFRALGFYKFFRCLRDPQLIEEEDVAEVSEAAVVPEVAAPAEAEV